MYATMKSYGIPTMKMDFDPGIEKRKGVTLCSILLLGNFVTREHKKHWPEMPISGTFDQEHSMNENAMKTQ